MVPPEFTEFRNSILMTRMELNSSNFRLIGN
jgi:hypothetical protein